MGNRDKDGNERRHMESPDMELFDLRVTVDHIDGRSVCGMAVGDHFDLVNSAELRLPAGQHFCIYALQSVLPFLAAKQRQLPDGDWLEARHAVRLPRPRRAPRHARRADPPRAAELRRPHVIEAPAGPAVR